MANLVADCGFRGVTLTPRETRAKRTGRVQIGSDDRYHALPKRSKLKAGACGVVLLRSPRSN
jgi:hypothetical protein